MLKEASIVNHHHGVLQRPHNNMEVKQHGAVELPQTKIDPVKNSKQVCE